MKLECVGCSLWNSDFFRSPCLCHTMHQCWHLGEITKQWFLLQRAIGNVSPGQLVSRLGPCLLLRKKENVSVPSPLPRASGPWVGACLLPSSLSLFFFLVCFLQSKMWWWMLYVDLQSPCHSSIRQGPQSPGKLSTSSLNECKSLRHYSVCG